MQLSDNLYRDKVLGCWLGKAVGGTLGMPFEGVDDPPEVAFYTPVPTRMLPNDDLDLQVVWACVMDRMPAPRVDRQLFADAWREHVQFPWDEYGVATRNLQLGLRPPFTGSCDNWFTCGLGAAIRSEIWACLAPGDPLLAAAYAYEDACVDHDGDGIWAEVFLAALESGAFVESDPALLLDQALSLLPATSQVRQAIADTRRWWEAAGDWRVVRKRILAQYGHENFTHVTMNLAFTILGWLAGNGDFGRSICIATACGKDTDCTAATLGALLGILNPAGIPEPWLKPIGRQLVLSPGITGLTPPANLDDFTDLVLRLRRRLPPGAPVAAPAAAPTPESLQILARVDFTGPAIFGGGAHAAAPAAPVLSAAARPLRLAGAMAEFPVAQFKDQVLLLALPFQLAQERVVKVLFNTPQNCRVWVDGRFLFGRECGRMAPSFHRAPVNQWGEIELAAGAHTLLAAIAKPETGDAVQWVAGLGDPHSNLWLADAFARGGECR